MMRLDRWLATLGIGSRAQVQKLVRSGSVQVDGAVQRDPGKSCDPDAQRLTVNGTPLDGRLMRHVMLHKPAGLLTAARDKKQPTVMDLLPDVYESIGCMPIGRLDKDTTGLLVFTCDGELNHRLLAPARHVDKVYRAVVDGPLDQSHVDAFASGLHLSDFDAQTALLRILRSGSDSAEAEVTVHEGKFHQVKRMFLARRMQVTYLKRVSIGGVALDESLEPGEYRELTESELSLLK